MTIIRHLTMSYMNRMSFMQFATHFGPWIQFLSSINSLIKENERSEPVVLETGDFDELPLY